MSSEHDMMTRPWHFDGRRHDISKHELSQDHEGLVLDCLPAFDDCYMHPELCSRFTCWAVQTTSSAPPRPSNKHEARCFRPGMRYPEYTSVGTIKVCCEPYYLVWFDSGGDGTKVALEWFEVRCGALGMILILFASILRCSGRVCVCVRVWFDMLDSL